MIIDGRQIMLDTATKFFNTLRLSGWFHHPGERLVSIALEGTPVIAAVTELNVAHAGVTALGPDKGFSAQFLRATEAIEPGDRLVVETSSGWRAAIPLLELCVDRTALYPGHALMRRFVERLDAMPGARVLDIGGRARSQVDRSASFGRADVTVLDILPGDNVDIVADAHDLSAIPEASFDAVYSVSVFEHLLMPWAVVPQINRILKPGGLLLVSTHQTLGMHDIPWDFWRFSDTAWDALLNAHTGFAIEERILAAEQFVLPFIYTPIKAWAERAAGFEHSAVLARKTGACRMEWKLTPADLVDTSYPAGVENPYEKK